MQNIYAGMTAIYIYIYLCFNLLLFSGAQRSKTSALIFKKVDIDLWLRKHSGIEFFIKHPPLSSTKEFCVRKL